MCKCLQYYLESCYWHLIEKRFCYDEDIALYEPPDKVGIADEEKNNNCFDNMAFFDSVSVIAGRAIVTIEPLEARPIVQQPTRGVHFGNNLPHIKEYISRSVPVISEMRDPEDGSSEKSSDEKDHPEPRTLSPRNLIVPDVEIRRKSLRERRMSKSLYLKIEHPKEIPIIRQQSMPKFFIETPDESHLLAPTITPSVTLNSPIPKKTGFVYDLYAVVQMERERVQNMGTLQKDQDKSRLNQIKERIKLRRVKSSLGVISSVPPQIHHM